MEFIKIYIRDASHSIREFELPNDAAYSLMEMLRAAELPVSGTCEGLALCASCHVYILSEHKLSQQKEDEIKLLDSLPNMQVNSRLSCQLRMDASLHNLMIEIASE